MHGIRAGIGWNEHGPLERPSVAWAITVLAVLQLGAGPSSDRRTVSEGPQALLKRIADPDLTLRVTEVRLKGSIDPVGSQSRRLVEESAVWPDRHERKTGPGDSEWVLMSPKSFRSAPILDDRDDPSIRRSFALARLRSLFVIRHLTEAVRRRVPSRVVIFGGRPMRAVEVRDPYGKFRILWDEHFKSLQGIDMGETRVYFTASARIGPWFYPVVHSYERGGVLSEILRVTEISTRPAG